MFDDLSNKMKVRQIGSSALDFILFFDLNFCSGFRKFTPTTNDLTSVLELFRKFKKILFILF